jgi:hypothetical protein
MMNLFGEDLPSGTVREQLQQVQDIHKCSNAANLHRKWAEIMFPALNEAQLRAIENAGRQARELFNQ